MSISTLTCSTCHYWVRNPVDPKKLGVAPTTGRCVRYPPTPLILAIQDASGRVQSIIQCAYPQTEQVEGCGEHSQIGDDDDENAEMSN